MKCLKLIAELLRIGRLELRWTPSEATVVADGVVAILAAIVFFLAYLK